MKTGMGEAMDASAGNAQLAAGIKSTGNAANVTVEGMNALASSIQAYSGQTDDSITASQKLLLTFTKIRNEGPDKIFDLATIATANMAAKMGGDASGAALQLGKALNDPIKGLMSLGRAGVQFSDEQKAAVQAMVEAGDIMGAQKVILGELETQFGGAAKAAGESLPGQLNKAKRAFENVSESIVSALIPIVLPALEKVGAVLTKNVIPAVEGFVAGFKDGTGAGGTFRDVLTKVGSVLGAVAGFLAQNRDVLLPLLGILAGVIAAIKILTIAQAALNVVLALNPIGLIVIALAALVAGIVYAYNNFEGFRNLVNAVWQGIQTVVAAVVGWFQAYVMPVMSAVFAAVVGYLKFLWSVYEPIWNLIYWAAEKVVTWFQVTAWPAIKGVIDNMVTGFQILWPYVQAAWSRIMAAIQPVVAWLRDTAWPAIQAVIEYAKIGFQVLWPIVKDAWDRIWTAVKAVVGWFTETALPAVQGFVSGMTTVFAGVVTFVAGIPGKITETLGNLGTLLYDAGSAIIGGLLRGITDKFEAVKSFIGGIGSWIADNKGPLSYDRRLLVPAGIAIMDGLNAGLRSQMRELARTTGSINAAIGLSPQVGSLDNASAVQRAVAVRSAGQPGAGNDALLDRLDRLIAAQEATARMIRDQAERDRTMARTNGYR